MATGYCNAPILVKTTGFAAESGRYFPCMVLRINENSDLDMVAECGSGKEVRFDLSGYSKGMLYKQTVVPTGSVPSITLSYRIWQKYYDDGESFWTERTSEAGSVTVYLGRGDKLSRFRGAESTAVSYKPASTEVVNTGDYYISRGQTTACNATVVSSSSTGVYIESNPLRHQLIFLNSFGRWESASALTRESKQYKYSSTSVDIDTDFPDNVGRPDMMSHRQLSEVVWSMSSGWCTKEWAEWWAKEVLAAEYVWLREGTKFIPVVLIPEDSTGVYNKAKGELPSINFKVKFI